MKKQKSDLKPDFESRAKVIHWKYGLDEKRVVKILSKLKVTRDEVVSESYFDYLIFEPCFETALFLFRPEIAALMFEKCDPEKINRFLESAYIEFKHLIDNSYSIEYICFMETEFHL